MVQARRTTIRLFEGSLEHVQEQVNTVLETCPADYELVSVTYNYQGPQPPGYRGDPPVLQAFHVVCVILEKIAEAEEESA